MPRITLKGKIGRVAAASALLGISAATVIVGGPSAGADPQQLTALKGVGSDTLDQVTNAFAGYVNGKNYTPVQSDLGGAKQQLISFDAVNPSGATGANAQCITTKTSARTFYRPNGSGQGQGALSRAIDLTSYTRTSGNGGNCASAGTGPINGLVDFARSSSPETTAGTQLTYIPMGRDALGVAAYIKGGTLPAGLKFSWTELNSLFTTGPAVIDPDDGGPAAPVKVIPCGIQSGSGTYKSWNTTVGVTAAQEAVGTAECAGLTGTARLQEHSGIDLKAKGDAAGVANGEIVIVGFSAAQYVSQINGVATLQIPGTATTPTVLMSGIIDDKNGAPGTDLGIPYVGTPAFPAAIGTLTPNASYYPNTVFGRDVYYVVSSARLASFSELGLKGMFVSTDVDNSQGKGIKPAVNGVPDDHVAGICSAAAETTKNAFGFLTIDSCGSTGVKTGGYEAS